MISASIMTVAAPERRRATAALVTAFSSDPFMRWVYPDPGQYLAYFPELIAALGGNAFTCDTAYCLDDFLATALWLPPGVHLDEEAVGDLVQRSIPAHQQEALFTIVEETDRYHPTEAHWYLPLIGVDPTRQGRGYGSMLLAQALERCDAEHRPAYLESSSPRNIPLYERHGFEVIGEVQAGDGPPLWPMLRAAR